MAGPSVAVRILGDLTKWQQSVSGAASTANTGAGRIKSAFGGVLDTLNKTGVLGPFSGALDGVSGALDAMSEKAGSAGAKLLGAGGAIAGLGAGLMAFGSSQKEAQQQLQVAIENTGGSYDAYASKIQAAVKEEEHHGDSAAETMNALQSLTQVMHDPQAALDALGTASDLAAAKHESLTSAAGDLGKAYNGNAKILKAFGISTTESAAEVGKQLEALGSAADISRNKHMSLTEAQKLLTAAQDGSASALKKLGITTKVSGTDAIQALADVTKGQGNAAADSFTGKMNALKASVEDNVATFANKFGPAITAGGAAMAGVGATMEVAKGIQEAFKDSTLLAKAATEAQTIAQAALNLVMDANPIMIVVLALAAITAAFILAYQHITVFREGVQALWTGIKAVFDAIKNLVGDVISWLGAHWPEIIGILAGPFGLLLSEVITHWNQVSDFLKGIPGKIGAIFSGAVHWLEQAGLDIVKGLGNGIKQGAEAAVNAVKDVGKDVVNGAKSLLHIGSPSTLFEGFGRDTIAGFVNGLQAGAASAAGAMGDAMSGVAAVGAAPSPVAAAGGPMVQFGDVTIHDATDLDLLAQRVSAALVAGRV